MLIPIGTDLKHTRHPMVTYFLIGINLLVFAAQWSLGQSGGVQSSNEFTRSISQVLADGSLSGIEFHFYTLITYQFLHAGWMHILGNMLFLLPFGKVVEDRMGHIGFVLFYLGSGAFGGVLHILFSSSPVIGASGSICAVTAAFIVLAPKTNIRVLLIFFIIGVYKIPSMLFVLFFVLFDAFSLLANLSGNTGSSTAWVVHLGGYCSGFAVTFALLAFGVIASTEFDLTQMIRQSKRRRDYQKAIAKPSVRKKSSSSLGLATHHTAVTIAQTAATGNVLAAANQFLLASNKNPSLKLDEKTHLQIGNALIQEGLIEEGVRVYELYIKIHSDSKSCGEVALLLVAKYTRTLNNTARAKELIRKYASTFTEKHNELVTSLTKELE